MKFIKTFILALLIFANMGSIVLAEFIEGKEILTQNDRDGYVAIDHIESWQNLKGAAVESKEDAERSSQVKTSYDADGNLIEIEEWFLPDGSQVTRRTAYDENSDMVYCKLIYGGTIIRFVKDGQGEEDGRSDFGFANQFGDDGKGGEYFYKYRDSDKKNPTGDYAGDGAIDPTLTIGVPKEVLEKLASMPAGDFDPNELRKMFDELSDKENEKGQKLDNSIMAYYDKVEKALVERGDALEAEGIEIIGLVNAIGAKDIDEEKKRTLIEEAIKLIGEYARERKDEPLKEAKQVVSDFVSFEEALRKEVEDLHDRIEGSYIGEVKEALYPFFEEVANDPGALILYKNDKKITSVIKLPAKRNKPK